MSLRWSEKDLAAYQARRTVSSGRVTNPTFGRPFPPARSGGDSGHNSRRTKPDFDPGESPLERVGGATAHPSLALGHLPVGKMNKTEVAYDDHLRKLSYAGQVLWWRFEGIKLRLANSTFYTPDFAVLRSDGVLELVEVKGFWRDDARVKIKVAASLFPFRFVAVKKRSSGWEREEF